MLVLVSCRLLHDFSHAHACVMLVRISWRFPQDYSYACACACAHAFACVLVVFEHISRRFPQDFLCVYFIPRRFMLVFMVVFMLVFIVVFMSVFMLVLVIAYTSSHVIFLVPCLCLSQKPESDFNIRPILCFLNF